MPTTKYNNLTWSEKRPVSETNNERFQFPGYSHYSPEEDISRKGKRIDENLEDVYDRLKNSGTKISSRLMVSSVSDHFEHVARHIANPTDVTKEDIQALGPKDLSMDMGDDEQLKQRMRPVDFAGKNLDVPGSDEDNVQEGIGLEDEENNLYSQSDSE